MRRLTRPAGTLLALLATLIAPAAAVAATKHAAPPRPDAASWILIDAGDGHVLTSHDPDARRSMASTTKLMTAYLALHDLSLDRRVTAPPYHPLPGESLMGLRAGEVVTVRSLLYGLLLPSGNDAAVTLADASAGSVSAFVTDMNDAAKRLRLTETHYANPVGLDDPGNHSSARDLASLAARLLRNPVFSRIVDTPRADIPGAHPQTEVNHNDLVRRIHWVNGVKTGWTPDADFVLVASGQRMGVTLIAAVMGAPSITTRDGGAAELLRWGFAQYHRRSVRKGALLGRARVRGTQLEIPLEAGREVSYTVRAGQDVRVGVHAPDAVRPPLARDTQVGYATIAVDGERVGRTPVVAGLSATVPGSEGGISGRLWAILGAGAAIVILIGWLVVRHRGRPSRGSF